MSKSISSGDPWVLLPLADKAMSESMHKNFLSVSGMCAKMVSSFVAGRFLIDTHRQQEK